jgi:anthranilate phosphoribosyltransferase
MELARMYGYLLQSDPAKQGYIVLRALDGYDEISLTGSFKLLSRDMELLAEPEALGLKRIPAHDLRGGASPEENAEIFMRILNGDSTASQNAVVCANAGVAIHCVTPSVSLPDAVKMAQESLDSKRALAAFQAFMNV